MIDRSDKTSQGPADIRSISDPPDMGKLRPAEEVARELVLAAQNVGALHLGDRIAYANKMVLLQQGTGDESDRRRRRAVDILADLIRQSRAEGAAAALEAAAEHFDEKLGDPEAGDILRARAKGISDPPDMG